MTIQRLGGETVRGVTDCPYLASTALPCHLLSRHLLFSALLLHVDFAAWNNAFSFSRRKSGKPAMFILEGSYARFTVTGSTKPNQGEACLIMVKPYLR